MRNNWTKFLLVGASLGGLLTLAACGSAPVTQPAANANNAHSGHDMSQTDGKTGAAYRAEFKTEPATVTAGQAATLVFTIKDKTGATVKDVKIVHEKPMHLLVVSTDLAEFHHLHPEPQSDGTFKAQYTFANGGNYKLYADFTPQDAAQVVERVDLKVDGAAAAPVPLAADTSLTKDVDGLRVTMKPSAPLVAGQELMLNFQMFDAKTGQPATDMQNYLGELAHFVIISQDLADFVHAHPMQAGEMKEGGMAGDHDKTPHGPDDKKMADMKGMEGMKSASEVAAQTAFPRAGLYKIWAQFQRHGKVIAVPFVVQVAENKTAAAPTDANAPADAIKVTVSKGGYTPANINATKGQPVKIAFYRADADNCGGEVLFPKLNIREKLPVGKTVVVTVTPTETGEFAFACGMGMLKGTLTVN